MLNLGNLRNLRNYFSIPKKRIESILSPLINIHRLMARMEKETLYK